jgi:hypothetical protein
VSARPKTISVSKDGYGKSRKPFVGNASPSGPLQAIANLEFSHQIATIDLTAGKSVGDVPGTVSAMSSD